MVTKSTSQLSYDTKTIIVVITLLMFYPVGVLLMFLWMGWPKWLKIIVGLPIFIILFGIAIALIMALISGVGYLFT